MMSRLSAPLSLFFAFVLAAQAQFPVPDNAKVLFIGNSLFGSKDGGVPEYANQAMQGMGHAGIQTGLVANWGESLKWGMTNAPKFTDLQGSPGNNLDAILNGPDGVPGGEDWDYVVLQGYGRDDATDNVIDASQADGVRGDFFDTVVALHNAATQVGAETVLYMRWPNNPGMLPEFYQTTLPRFVSNYDTIAAHLGGLAVVPVALITDDLTYQNPPDTSVLASGEDRFNYLYVGDNIHQSELAKGMFGYAVATILMRTSPIGNPFEHGGYVNVPPSIDLAHQESVWRIVSSRESWVEGSGGGTQGMILSRESVQVAEGGTASVTIRLAVEPEAAVTVTLARLTGDADLTVGTSSLTFDATNWSTAQSFSISAANDADDLDGSATFELSAPGLPTKTLVADEVDDDLPEGIGLVWAESGGVVAVQAENYFRKTDAGSYAWTLQVDGVDEASDLSGSLGNYMALLPDLGFNVHERSTSGGDLLLDAANPLDFRIQLTTPGTYRLYPRAAGPGGGADSLYAGIVELRDGDGGVNGGNADANDEVIADWYDFRTPTSSFDWINLGTYESDEGKNGSQAAEWTITEPGIYTLRFNWREDGVALDSFVLQLSSLSAPSGAGPEASRPYQTMSELEQWANTFAWPEGADQSPGFDFDRDGFTLLQEFHGGTDPTSSSERPEIEPIWVDVEGTPVFGIRFHRRAGTESVYALASPDLTNWYGPEDPVVAGTVLHQAPVQQEPLESVTYILQESLRSGDRSFLRVFYGEEQ